MKTRVIVAAVIVAVCGMVVLFAKRSPTLGIVVLFEKRAPRSVHRLGLAHVEKVTDGTTQNFVAWQAN